MKSIAVFLIIAISLFLNSCKTIETLYPLSENENDFIFKKELLGKWVGKKDTAQSIKLDTAEFFRIDTVEKTNGKLYSAEIVSPNEKSNASDTGHLLFRLLKIDDWYFINYWLDFKKTFTSKLNEEDYNEWLIIKYFFCHINFDTNDKIEITFPDGDKLLKLISDKKISLHYTELGKDEYLILDKSNAMKKNLKESKKYFFLPKDKITIVRF